MNKITRYDGDVKPFASSSQGTERTIFGEVTQSDELTDQITTSFLRGWGIVGPNENPSLQDFSAAMFTSTKFIAYLHQMGIAEWNATQEYHKGSLANIGGVVYTSKSDDNVGNNPATDRINWDDNIKEVEPRNNDWNGYLDPAHTVPIENEDTSAGTRSFAADTEVAPNLYVSTATDVTFSTTGISWLAGNSLHKLCDYTTEQLDLIDVNSVPVYLVGQDGAEHFVNNSTSGVTVSKVGSQLKVEIDFAIFSSLGITKLWRFFVTERVGRVVELSPDEVTTLVFYKSNSGGKWKIASLSAGVEYVNSNPYPIIVSMVAQGAPVDGQSMRGTLLVDTIGGVGGKAISRSSVSGTSFAGSQQYTVCGKIPSNSTYTFSEDSTSSVTLNFFILEM